MKALPKDAQREILYAILMLAAAWLAGQAGWNGSPRTVGSSLFWPFYVDTWFLPADRWSWRAVLPLLTMAGVWPLMRRWLASGSMRMLFTLVAAAWVYHLSVGFVRHGFIEGLTFTFTRSQEYWWDVHNVEPGFLARFPDLSLSQHGGTHPPGIILLLALVRKLGFTSIWSAEIVCTPLGALGALPLWAAARRLTDHEIARWAVVLYLFGCSIAAFSVLSMDMVVVLFASIALYGFAHALDGEVTGGIICGLSLAAAALCSFLALTLPLTWVILLLTRRRRWLPLIAAVAVFMGFYLALALGFGYRPLQVLSASMTALAHSEDTTRSASRSLLGNPIAFLGSLGVAFTGLSLRALCVSFTRRDATTWLVWAALAPVAFNTLAGLPRGEAERIYMPFIPPLAIAAAAAARRWFRRDPAWLTNVAAPLWVVQSILIESLYETYW